MGHFAPPAESLRVLDKSSVARLARCVQPALSNPTIDRWIREAIAARRLQRVVRRTYLNRFVHPAALPCEAAVWLRPGAIISLQTVLGMRASGITRAARGHIAGVAGMRCGVGYGVRLKSMPSTISVRCQTDPGRAGCHYRHLIAR